MRTRSRLSWTAIALVAAVPAAGQEPAIPEAAPTEAVVPRPAAPAPRSVASCEDKRPVMAVAQTLGVNLVVNRINAWVFGWDFGHVGFESWSRNLYRGWKWDATQFGVNMFVHPYHGSLYFAAARANCLGFWESVPIVFLGSWTWEYFGETHRASLNDFFTTGFGGPVLGEMLHRVSTAIVDEEAEGGERLAREVTALIVNPVGGLNRLLRGQWGRQGVNPVDRIPESYLFRTRFGGRRVEEVGKAGGPTYSPTLILEVSYGDAFDTEYGAPFDVVRFLVQLSRDGGAPNLLRTVGRLYGRELTDELDRHRHQLVINQRFEYANNPVYNFGEQTLEVGLQSRWGIGFGGLTLSTRFAADVVVLGAVEALDPDAVELADDGQREIRRRTIDWGPGLGAIAELSLELDGVTYISFYNRVRYIGSVSGEPADHTLLFSGLDFTVPITRQLGVGMYVSWDRRTSDYTRFTDVDRSYSETRVFLTWTPLRSAPGRPE